MVYKESEGLLVVRLDNDEEFPGTLRKLFDEVPYMESGVILSALGMLNNFELGYFKEGKYIVDRFEKPMELITISGSISRSGEPWYHLHAALAGENKEVVGGHLFNGTVWGVMELFILVSDISLDRVQKGNLKVLKLD